MPLRLCDKRVKGVAKRAEPEPVVDHLRPLLGDDIFEPRDLLRQRDVFQRLVRLQEQHRGRRFVDLARLDADQPVLEMIDAADAVFPAHPVQGRHQIQGRDWLAVERDRNSFFEANLDIGRLVGALARVAGPGVDVFRRLSPRILEHACLDRAAPQVLVRRVGRAGRGRNLDAVLGRVVDLVVAVHAPLAHRRDHLQVGCERSGRHVEAHLVVALARASMRYRLGAFATRDLDHHGRDQRPAKRGRQRILLFIDRTGLQGRPDKEL